MKFIDERVFNAGMLPGTLYSDLEQLQDMKKGFSIKSYDGFVTNREGARGITFDVNYLLAPSAEQSAKLNTQMQEAVTQVLQHVLESVRFQGLNISLQDFFVTVPAHDHRRYAVWEPQDFVMLRKKIDLFFTTSPAAEERIPKLYIWVPKDDEQHTIMVTHFTKEEAFAQASLLVKGVKGIGFNGWGTDTYALTTKDIGEAFVIQYE